MWSPAADFSNFSVSVTIASSLDSIANQADSASAALKSRIRRILTVNKNCHQIQNRPLLKTIQYKPTATSDTPL
jgi:hypothetical protein